MDGILILQSFDHGHFCADGSVGVAASDFHNSNNLFQLPFVISSFVSIPPLQCIADIFRIAIIIILLPVK